MGQPPGERRRRSWPQRLVIALNVVLIMSALATAGGLAYVYSRSTDIQRVALGQALTAEPVEPGEPQNFLIIGLDNVPEGEPGYREGIGPERSDTVMVLRLDPESERAALVSFPRDLYLSIPDVGRDRINAAIQHGGPEALIATIVENFDIPIHHYVALDLDGFKQLVDLVGGIPIYFPEPVRDRKSGLSVPEAGCIVLDAEQALAYARSRSYEFRRDGRWRVDGSGDLGRISRQQDFIRRALDRAISRGIRNPVVLRELVEAGIGSVRLDEDLTVDDLVDLGRRFRSFNPNTLAMYTLPAFDDVAGGSAVLRLVESQAEPILDIFRGTGDQVEPGVVRAAVLNGTGQAGLAAQAAELLRTAGFTVPPEAVGDAERFDFAGTVVRYQPGFEPQAALLQRYLAGGATLEAVEELDVAPVVVVVGTDWAGVLQTPRAPDSSPAPSDPAATTTPSSTTVVGEVPETPSEVAC